MPLLAATGSPCAEASSHSNRGRPAARLAERSGSMAAAKLIIENWGTRKNAIRTGCSDRLTATATPPGHPRPANLYSTKHGDVAVHRPQVGFAHEAGGGSTDYVEVAPLVVEALHRRGV
jgi:hypothetical protein